MILGPSGSGKTTMGRLTAEKLGYAFIDIDEYIWRKDTEIPFTQMYPREEKIRRLMDAVSKCSHFVMAGSMDSFHEYFDPFFELAVYLYADVKTRTTRVHEREFRCFGARILEHGDMYESHQEFLKDVSGYDSGTGGCTRQGHEKWLQSLSCRILRLDGTEEPEKNLKKIVEVYQENGYETGNHRGSIEIQR